MEKVAYRGRMLSIVEKDVERRGIRKTFEYARRAPGARLIIPRGDEILLTREFRHEQQGYDFRLPGGKVFDTLIEYEAALASGADIAEAARVAAVKEAREEAGLEVSALSLFHRSICGATVVWDLFYFAVDAFVEGIQALEDGEDISIEWVAREEAKKMCLDGRIGEERSALVLLRYLGA